jgi:hypothetical protein
MSKIWEECKMIASQVSDVIFSKFKILEIIEFS